MSKVKFFSWKELHEAPVERPPFLIDPILPEGGIVLLHGYTSLGKSPLTWHIAKCVGTGQDFFGLKTRQGKVCYLEVDTPDMLVKSRVDNLEPAENVWFTFFPHLNILMPLPEHHEHLGYLHHEIKPDLVIVNTLRKVHNLEDTKSHVPAMVYNAFQKYFPGSALLFVHHDTKDPIDPKARRNPDQAFSGSQHWVDDAQVAMHLMKHGGVKGCLRLEHTKSQVSAKLPPLILRLADDGAHIGVYSEERKKEVAMWQTPEQLMGATQEERDKALAAEMRVSDRTVRRWRSKENG